MVLPGARAAARAAATRVRRAAACRVFGSSPSTVIPSIAVVANLLCAVAMPVVGAVVDYTSKRLATLRCMGAVFMFTNFVQIFLTAETWFAMTVIQASIGSVTFLAQVVCNAAYVPELARPGRVPKPRAPRGRTRPPSSSRSSSSCSSA